MKHYGDITKLSGYDLPIVDVITGGSPCQDLSVAGNRQGLDGERSSLFLEQIRIVKEMREHDTEQLRSRGADVDIRFIRPRFLIWENVPGALSSGKPRYKALGNSIALPYWKVLARRICAQYDRDVTMGSLFDGIGGFPLAFEHCGAKAVWASEIEEFCIAVTKEHFPEEGEG